MNTNLPQDRKIVLCPLDLSDQSLTAIDLATLLARNYRAVLRFIFVSPIWLPTDTLLDSDYVQAVTEEEEATFMKIRPASTDVSFEHVLVHGNPGPEIVKASSGCDAIVMATHGHGAIVRLLMGSVAHYVLRHAKCQVILSKSTMPQDRQTRSDRTEENYVTQLMHHIQPIHDHDKMDDVLAELDKAGQTAAPVVDIDGKCIGILTKTDIEHFHELQRRYDQRDATVIPEMFESDKYGHIRCGNTDFTQVCRHMSQPVVTINNGETAETANQRFADNPAIHHLVVIDDTNHPVGILIRNLAGKVSTA